MADKDLDLELDSQILGASDSVSLDDEIMASVAKQQADLEEASGINIRRFQDFAPILLNNFTLGLSDEFQAFSKAGRGEASVSDALKEERQKLADAEERASKREGIFGISDKTIATVLGMGLGGLDALAATAPAKTLTARFASKVEENTLKNLISRVGPEQAALVLETQPLTAGSKIANLGKSAAVDLSQGAIAGAGYSQATSPEEVLQGLKSGAAAAGTLKAALGAVKMAGGMITGLSDAGGKAVFNYAKKTGLNLADPEVERIITNNFTEAVNGRVAANGAIEARGVKQILDENLSNLGRHKDNVITKNEGRVVPVTQSFENRLNALDALSKSHTKADEKAALSAVKAELLNNQKNLRIGREVIEEVKDGSTDILGLPQTKSEKQVRLTDNAEFKSLDNYRMGLGRQIFEEGRFDDFPALKKQMVDHYNEVSDSLAKYDGTGTLKEINDVYTALYSSKSKMPKVGDFAADAKPGAGVNPEDKLKDFHEALAGKNKDAMYKYAPDLQVDVYATLAPAYSDMLASNMYKRSVLRPFAGVPLFSTKIGARLTGEARSLPVVGGLGQAGAVGLESLRRGVIRRGGGAEGVNSLRNLFPIEQKEGSNE